ncbi:MAG: HEAT repeat domain-containing protein, partial [Deltaproteobacteria bacterium]|nr:HEAT repeat domain-containing protein [Deltaproteobacteria bacterium]
MTERPPSPTELSSQDPEVRRLAVRALSRAPEVSPGLVLTALGDVDWRVRKEAVDAARAFAGSRELLSGLVDALLPGDNVGMRNAAVEAIGAHGGAALEVLRARLPGLDADGRKLAVEAAALTADPAALGLLAELL